MNKNLSKFVKSLLKLDERKIYSKDIFYIDGQFLFLLPAEWLNDYTPYI